MDEIDGMDPLAGACAMDGMNEMSGWNPPGTWDRSEIVRWAARNGCLGARTGRRGWGGWLAGGSPGCGCHRMALLLKTGSWPE